MAETIWQGGKRWLVLTQVGKRANGEKRYIRAGFDLMTWDSTGSGTESLYALAGGGGSNGNEQGVDVDGADVDFQVGMDFGFYDNESIIMDPVIADGGSDAWTALHYFGWI